MKRFIPLVLLLSLFAFCVALWQAGRIRSASHEAELRKAFLDGMLAEAKLPCDEAARKYQIEAIRAMGGYE